MKRQNTKVKVTSNFDGMTKDQKERFYQRLNEALNSLFENVVKDKVVNSKQG